MSTKTASFVFHLFSVLMLLALSANNLGVTPVHAAGTLFVKTVGTGNCSSWATACTLQTALDNAVSGNEIWVVAGTHKPTIGTDRSATFQLKSGVGVYGGFAGTEIVRTERYPVTNVTILSGEIGVTGNSDNSYHVITGASGATLDGFTITAGNANGTFPNYEGGGMLNKASSPTLKDVTFSNNSASIGGGMYNYSSSPILMNVTFSGNSATNFGGGMANSTNSNPTLKNVTFSANSAATFGGGMSNYSSSPILTFVTFSTNSATSYGGGMYNESSSNPQIRSTIFWGNMAATEAQIYEDDTCFPEVSESVVQGGYAGGTNITTSDPMLGALGEYGGNTRTIPLLPGSSAVDILANGTNGCGTTIVNDQRNVTRPQRGKCDIGAYEYNYTDIYYVKPVVSGTGNCQSWANACTLQNALTTAFSDDEIWVAKGTHKPTTGIDRTATFQLKSGVTVYGGFAGTETARTQRNHRINVTILSGEIGEVGKYDNSYHVIIGATGATLDGFTITGGNANGVSPNNSGGGMGNVSSNPTLTNITFSSNSADNGGGMYNYSSSPMLTNITFSENSSKIGGGIYNYSSSPILTNITFSGNSATDFGGGMSNNTGSNPTLTNVTFSSNSGSNYGGGMYNHSSSPALANVTFSNNSASIGGGMYNYSSSPTLTNITFSGNSAINYGGGMCNWDNSNPTLANVTFRLNVAEDGGGMFNDSSSPWVTNVTFNGNSADKGGGMYSQSNGNPQIRNTIFWGNTALTTGAQIYNLSCLPFLNDSVVQDGCPTGSSCTNIITTDPKLGILGNYGGFTKTIPLLVGSSAINTGNDATCPATDQRGILRPQGPHCDIGAYEFDAAIINVYIGGNLQGSYTLEPGSSQRVNYAGLDSGPVRVVSTNGLPIISAIRSAWAVNGVTTSFSQLMGLPLEQLSDTYVFPGYNNVTLNDQLRIANVDTSPTSVTVTIGGDLKGTYPLAAGEAVRINYPGLDSGPVVVKGTSGVKIISSIREAWAVNGVTTSFVQLMGLPATQLSNKYVYAGYNNVTLNEQLRIGNVDPTQSTVVTVTIGGDVQGIYPLGPGQAVRINYPGLDSGPVIVEGTAGVNIISSIRDAWAVNGVTTSFSQLMGMPVGQLSDKYLFPGYNNVTLNEQLRIANVDTVPTIVTVTIGGDLKGTYPLAVGEAVRINYPNLDSGPVVVQGTSGVKIISSIREAWAVNGVTQSFVQLMGLPAGQLSTTYLFPAYNNVTLNEQLRIGMP